MNLAIRTTAAFTTLCLFCFGVQLRAEEGAAAIIQKAFEASKANEAAVRSYVFHERIEERRFNRKGGEKERRARTYDVTLLETSEYRQLIAKDDQPLSEKEAAKEQRKLDKQIKKMQSETGRQREKRLARVEKGRQEGEEFLEEITRAFEFRLVGEEVIDGIATHVISAEPMHGYSPGSREARVLTKLRGTLWVAKEDYGWAKADIDTIDDFTWAVVFKLRKGAQIHFEQSRNDNGVWLAESWYVRFRAKVAQLMKFNVELTAAYSTFRKFSTDTTVNGWSVD